MKFLCSACDRLVELRDFKLEDADLALTCPACGAVSRVSAPAPMALVPLTPVVPAAPLLPVPASPSLQSSAAAPALAPERPPLQLTSFPGVSNVVALRTPGVEAVASAAAAAKNGPFNVPESRCPKCIAPRAKDEQACPQCGLNFNAFDPAHFEPIAWLKESWVDLLSHWDDEGKHEALRSRALRELELAAVARLYRLRLASLPEDPFAQRGRDEVLRLALLPDTTAGAERPKPDQQALRIAVVGLFILAALVVLALMARQMLEPSGW